MDKLDVARKVYNMYTGRNGETKLNGISIERLYGISQPDVSRVVKAYGEIRYGTAIETGLKKVMVSEPQVSFLDKYKDKFK